MKTPPSSMSSPPYATRQLTRSLSSKWRRLKRACDRCYPKPSPLASCTLVVSGAHLWRALSYQPTPRTHGPARSSLPQPQRLPQLPGQNRWAPDRCSPLPTRAHRRITSRIAHSQRWVCQSRMLRHQLRAVWGRLLRRVVLQRAGGIGCPREGVSVSDVYGSSRIIFCLEIWVPSVCWLFVALSLLCFPFLSDSLADLFILSLSLSPSSFSLSPFDLHSLINVSSLKFSYGYLVL